MNIFKTLILSVSVLLTSFSQVNVRVNLNVMHEVGGITNFDRQKWITVHTDITEPDWDGEMDKMEYLLKGLDSYAARQTGGTTYWTSTYDSAGIIANADWQKTTAYGVNEADRHPYESQEDLIIACQDSLYYSVPSGTELGTRLATYATTHYGTGGVTGKPAPSYVEIMNEPVWPLHDDDGVPLSSIFNYHNEAAIAFKAISSLPIGGFVCAFPILEENNFSRWNNRWKAYMDTCGANTDFYSIHLYDFPGIGGGNEMYRKGANNEATLDMIEHYGELTGQKKPFLISEYGSQLHDWYYQTWTAYRDWLCVKAFNNMMLQFMERPDMILKALPFTTIKATWGDNYPSYPYYWRMMRRTSEPANMDGTTWVWTEYIKHYELWSNVNGTRVDTIPDDINIQVDSYVSGNTAFIIINSLYPASQNVTLDISGYGANTLSSVKSRHLYWTGSAVTVDYATLANTYTPTVTVGGEGTVILEYTFSGPVSIDESSAETKYYADTYLQPIVAANNINFNVNGVSTSTYGEAVLRLGVGRDQWWRSLTPTVTVNGTQVTNAAVYRGDNQQDRGTFFGLLEIPVPYEALNANNTISVTFSDTGGYVSSCALQVFNFSSDVRQTGLTNVPVSGLSYTPAAIAMGIGENTQITASVLPTNASVKGITYNSDNSSVASVNVSGLVSGIAVGSTTVTLTSVDNGSIVSNITVNITNIPVTGITISPTSMTLGSGASGTVIAQVVPVNASEQGLSYLSLNPAVATVNSSGLVTAVSAGTAIIRATSTEGGFTANSTINVGSAGIIIEAEDLVSQGGTFPSCSTTGIGVVAGVGINCVNNGDWAEYNFTVPEAGDYVITYHIATPAMPDPNIIALIGGTTFETNTVADTGGWDTYVAQSSGKTITLAAGANTFRIEAIGSDWQWNLDKIVLSLVSGGTNVAVTGISVSPTTMGLVIGQSGMVSATVTPTNATVTTAAFFSENTNIATVDAGGNVTGISAGTTEIVAISTDGAYMATNIVTVSNIAVSGVDLTPPAVSLGVGDTSLLTASVLPTNAAVQTVTYDSDNTNVATVTSGGMVTAISAGSATITVTTTEGGFTDTTVVTVTNIQASSVSINPTNLDLVIAASALLTETVLPANTTDKSVTWSSDNTNIATVNAIGQVTAVGPGMAVITVTTVSGGYFDTATVNVTIPPAIPAVSFLSGPGTSITTNAAFSIELTVTGPNGFWSTNSGLSWVQFSSNSGLISIPGTVSLMYYGSAGAGYTSATNTVLYIVNLPLPPEPPFEGDFTILPNPVNAYEDDMVEFGGGPDNVKIIIYTLYGERAVELEKNERIWNLRNDRGGKVAGGTYFIKCIDLDTNDEQIKTMRIIR